MDIAPEIRGELARRGLTQADLADALGITRQALTSKMRGHTEFKFSELDVVAETLGLPLSVLIARAEQGAPTPVAA